MEQPPCAQGLGKQRQLFLGGSAMCQPWLDMHSEVMETGIDQPCVGSHSKAAADRTICRAIEGDNA